MRLLGFGLISVVTLGIVMGGAACTSFAEADDPVAETGTDDGQGSPVDGQTRADAGVDGSDVDAAPKVLAQNLGDDLTGIDTNTTTAFVIEHDAGTILFVDLEEGGTSAIGAAGAQSPSAILAFEDRIVWADFGHQSLSVLGLTGGAQVETASIPLGPDAGPDAGPEGPSAMAHLPGGSGFLLATSDTVSGRGSVASWTSRPLAPATAYYRNPSRVNVFDVAATATTLYWTESSTATVWGISYGPVGAMAAPVATLQSDCESIAAEGNDVCWAMPRAGLVSMATGLSTKPFAVMEDHPFSLAVDSANVYWLTLDGTLRRASRADGHVVTIASGFKASFADPRVHAIALTSAYVVWITSDGRVLRLPK